MGTWADGVPPESPARYHKASDSSASTSAIVLGRAYAHTYMLSMRVKMTRLHIDDIATTLTSRSAPRHHLIIIIYT
jgi:hypothetical protein